MHQQTCFSISRRSMLDHARLQGWLAAAHVLSSFFCLFLKATGGRFILALNGKAALKGILMVEGESALVLREKRLWNNVKPSQSFFCRSLKSFSPCFPAAEVDACFRNKTNLRAVSAHNDLLVNVCGLVKEVER